jgi:hypothetical protein
VVAFWIVAVLAGQAEAADARRPVQIVCNTGYKHETCRAQVGRLSEVLARFDMKRLGDWTWVLVKSDDWQPILRRVGRDSDSPAFTILEKRQTFLEEALFAATPDRARTLLAKWRVPLDRLLEHATAHELGHALCQETAEPVVIRYAEELIRTGQVECQTTPPPFT